MSSFIGIFFGFLFGNMFGFEDISTQLFNQDTKLLNILEKTRRMCKKIPPSLTGFDVVGLSYHGSRIANLPATAATMLQPYIGHRLFHHNLFGLLMTIPNPAELRDFPISVKGGQLETKKTPN